jgi:hypothetical protein
VWEWEIGPCRGRLEQLTAGTRLRLAVEAVDWTLRTSVRPIGDRRAAEWIQAVMAEARTAVARGAERVDLSSDLADQFDEVDDGADETGVSQLLMGIANCWGFESMTSDALEGTLYSCYVFALQREVPEPETSEEEDANPRCREVIRHQRGIIDEAGVSASAAMTPRD